MRLLPQVLLIIKTHLNSGTQLFRWDTGLVGDGCFFAGFLAAGGERDYGSGALDADIFVESAFKQENADAGSGQDDGVEVCLRALREMRWAFAKAEEREQTIRMVLEERRAAARHRLVNEYSEHAGLDMNGAYHHHDSHAFAHQHPEQFLLAPDRPFLPPLSLTLSPRQTLMGAPGTTSAPHTGGTDSSASGWPTYTPPGTGTSGGSGSTGFSATNSPVYSTMPSSAHMLAYHKGVVPGDMFYQTQTGAVEMDPFSFSVPAPMPGYHHQRGGAHSGGNFMDSVFGGAVSGTVLADVRLHTASDEGSGGSQFGDDCSAFYSH
jgi:hypothetical protein